jgi:hypothetical protein
VRGWERAPVEHASPRLARGAGGLGRRGPRGAGRPGGRGGRRERWGGAGALAVAM